MARGDKFLIIWETWGKKVLFLFLMWCVNITGCSEYSEPSFEYTDLS